MYKTGLSIFIIRTLLAPISTFLADMETRFLIAIGLGIALFILLVIFFVLLFSRKNKNTVGYPAYTPPPFYPVNPSADKTEFIGEVHSAPSHYTIKLSNSNNPGQTWTLPITGDLLIGRAGHCALRLEDKSVSREQCKILAQGEGLLVMHLGSTNKTALNGQTFDYPSPLKSGDTLKVGRVFLRIDYIQSLGTLPPRMAAPENRVNGQTEAIF